MQCCNLWHPHSPGCVPRRSLLCGQLRPPRHVPTKEQQRPSRRQKFHLVRRGWRGMTTLQNYSFKCKGCQEIFRSFHESARPSLPALARPSACSRNHTGSKSRCNPVLFGLQKIPNSECYFQSATCECEPGFYGNPYERCFPEDAIAAKVPIIRGSLRLGSCVLDDFLITFPDYDWDNSRGLPVPKTAPVHAKLRCLGQTP